MASQLFADVLNRRLEKRLTTAQGKQYAAKTTTYSGVVLSSNCLNVAGMPYYYSAGDTAYGSKLTVYNGSRLASVLWSGQTGASAKSSTSTIQTGQAAGGLTVKEEDGTPTVNNVTSISFSNGTVTDNGNGSVSVAGGGSSLTIEELDGNPSTSSSPITTLKVPNYWFTIAGGIGTLTAKLKWLADVTISTRPAAGAALVYRRPDEDDETLDYWAPGTGGVKVAVYDFAGFLNLDSTSSRMYNITGATYTIDRLLGSLAIAPGADSVVAVLQKNGSTIQTFTFTDTTPVEYNNINVLFGDGDYLSCAITAIGPADAPGGNLTIHARMVPA